VSLGRLFHLTLTFGLEEDTLLALERMAGFVEQAGEPLGDLPGVWRDIAAGTAFVVRPGDDETVPFAPRRP
jgi:hypothetical protein